MTKKLTTEEFNTKAKEVHEGKYNYSQSRYINNSTKVSIICPEHGEFKQTPATHLSGSGCPKCIGKQLTNEEILNKVKKIHGNKYIYSQFVYVNYSTKVSIICPEHGIFKQLLSSHLQGSGCSKCSGNINSTTEEFIKRAKEVHGDKYNYDNVKYNKALINVNIKCLEHGEFKQRPANHLQGRGCPKCSDVHQPTTKEFIEKARKIHGDKYDYTQTNYINAKTKVSIICPDHGLFTQAPNSHLQGIGCIKCIHQNANLTTEEFIKKVKQVHGDKYDYSNVEYINIKTKVLIICPDHGLFTQAPANHLQGQGCPICNHGFNKQYKLNLINSLEYSDLLTMDPFEIYTIISQGKLPADFGSLANTDANSDERIATLQELKDRLATEPEDSTDEVNTTSEIDSNDEFIEVDDVDAEITSEEHPEQTRLLPSFNAIADLRTLDNSIYASIDEEAFEALIQYKLRKTWNNLLNDVITIESIQAETGGKYFTIIKDLFLSEYNDVIKYQPKEGYAFKYQPNLMQKLTVHRLLNNKSYGNWSGTGAGKTLSFILASREIDSRLTVMVALNSTIKQTCSVIKEVYPDSKTYTDYYIGMQFDRSKHNYLVLNYEKFQQGYSEERYQDLTNNNQIDFVVIDEVHNVKQSDSKEESLRRGVLSRILGRVRNNNKNLYTLIMSATPVVNELSEAKSLLTLLTGLEYDDLQIRKTLSNALKMFQQLILNGLRYIPKYNIDITELTGFNMSNLNIDGQHLLDELLDKSVSDYIGVEKLLLPEKLKSIQPYLKRGVVIYTYFTTDFINKIEEHLTTLGFTHATYTGDESLYIREENLSKFLRGEIDILIGSNPIGTGVDGLQSVCNRMIILTLPWTDSVYTQLKGRIYRQGSTFSDVEIIIPQVRISTGENEMWSWDVQRLNLIRNKKTLADAAVDGIVPSRVLPTRQTLFKKSQESLAAWKERVNNGNIINNERQQIQIELYPEIADSAERERRILSELSEFNQRGKTTTSMRMHKEFTDNPESFFRYHRLRNERMEKWDEIPYEYIATKIKNRNHKVVDFGCGENKFKDCIPNNTVISFDHVAFDDSVIGCDIRDVSEHLSDESVDVAVFSLALWGTNFREYIKEAYRVLNFGGVIHIAEPAKYYETEELLANVSNLITEVGFKVIGNVEKRGKFIYITGFKE